MLADQFTGALPLHLAQMTALVTVLRSSEPLAVTVSVIASGDTAPLYTTLATELARFCFVSRFVCGGKIEVD